MKKNRTFADIKESVLVGIAKLYLAIPIFPE